MRQHGVHASCPVICVGNLVAGGAGKTPTSIFIAGELKALGYRPVFLTRGYGGTVTGPVVVDLAHHTAQEIGDEAPLLARHAPVIVSHDRNAGAKLAAQHGDVIVMDDGLQNPSLEKDCSIAVIDDVQGIGNARIIPAGPLRAPLSVQMEKVDLCLLIGDGGKGFAAISQFSKPCFHATLQPDPTQIAYLQSAPVMAFAGIGRPEKFFHTLEHNGITVVKSVSFPDHHPYRPAELEQLIAEAKRDALVLVTTAKDAVRIHANAPDLANQISVLEVNLVSANRTGITNAIVTIIGKKSQLQN